MKRFYVGLVALSALLFSTVGDAAGAAVKSGIVKGRITIAGRPSRDVVVAIEGVPAASAPARLALMRSKGAVMDQRDNKFLPPVLAVVVGTKVAFPNNDKGWHNVYSKGGAKDFDLGLYQPGKSREVTFEKAGVVRILCNVHPNMEAYIVIKEHPFFAIADMGGNYRIDGIPLGNHRITVWHPELGTTEAGVRLVRDGQVSDIHFNLKKK